MQKIPLLNHHLLPRKLRNSHPRERGFRKVPRISGFSDLRCHVAFDNRNRFKSPSMQQTRFKGLDHDFHRNQARFRRPGRYEKSRRPDIPSDAAERRFGNRFGVFWKGWHHYKAGGQPYSLCWFGSFFGALFVPGGAEAILFGPVSQCASRSGHELHYASGVDVLMIHI